MKTIIYSPYDCVVKYKNNQQELSQNEHLVFEEAEDIISIYPVGKNSRYSFEIDLKDDIQSNFYSKIKKEDRLLIFLIDGLISENIDIFSFTHKDIDSFVEISKNQLTFRTNHHKKVITLSNPISNIQCGNFEHIDYIYFIDKKKEYIIAYNTLSNKAKLLQGEKIEIKDNGFTITNENNNFYKKIVEDYIIDCEGLKVKSKVFVKKENISSNLLIFNFMNAIKIKDYDNAYSFLSDKLKRDISKDTIRNYFGDVSYFYIIDSHTVFAISNGNNIVYDFSILDSKINEINDNLD